MNETLTGNEKRFLSNPPMMKMDDGHMYVAARTPNEVRLAWALEKKGKLRRCAFSVARWTKV